MRRVAFMLPEDIYWKVKQLAGEGPEAAVFREAIIRFVETEIMKGQM